MKKIGWILLALVLTGPGGGSDLFASRNASLEELAARITQEASVSDLVDYAYRENPAVREAREDWKAVVESYRVATAYPDPQLMATYMIDPIETRLGPQDWNATLTQPFPFPGKLSKAGEIVESEARIARLKLDKAIRDVVVSIRESFFELTYIRQAATVADRNLELLRHLRKVAETAHSQDRAAFIDVVRAQSQEGQLRYDMLLLQDLEATEIARLNGILNRSPDAAIGPLIEEPDRSIVFPLDEIYGLAAENQEEIRMAKTAVERAEKRVDMARYENLPEFRVGLFYAGIGQPEVAQPPRDAGKDAFGVQAGMSLPLWFGKNKGRVNRALAEKEKAKAAETGRITQTNTDLRAVYFRLENSRRLMDLYQKELLPQAAKAMEIAETWFREGESGFSDFVETQAVWYNFNLAYARARADHGKYLARLERLVGRSLTEREPLAEKTGKEAK